MLQENNSGVYLLEILLKEEARIKIGKKGFFLCPAGFYCYTGSAQKNMQSRLARHCRKKKKRHWHIDYLLEWAEVLQIHTWQVAREGECRLAAYLHDRLNGVMIIPGFGASDCSCQTHLLYFNKRLKEKELPAKDYFSK